MRNNLLSDDDDIDKTFDNQTKHAIFVSLSILILLIIAAMRLFTLSNRQMFNDVEEYETYGTVLAMYKQGDSYFMTVECYYSETTEYLDIELTKEEFVKYKEQEQVKIKIRGSAKYLTE